MRTPGQQPGGSGSGQPKQTGRDKERYTQPHPDRQRAAQQRSHRIGDGYDAGIDPIDDPLLALGRKPGQRRAERRHDPPHRQPCPRLPEQESSGMDHKELGHVAHDGSQCTRDQDTTVADAVTDPPQPQCAYRPSPGADPADDPRD